MQIHATCVARQGRGILLLGPSGAGKSDLALRLIDRGFVLVADDRVELDGALASPPASLAGLIEVRGIGIVRLPHEAPVTLAVVLDLAAQPDRLPAARLHAATGVPLLALDPREVSAPEKAALAFECALGQRDCLSGGFAPT